MTWSHYFNSCLPHTINLVAKVLTLISINYMDITLFLQAFISFFFRQPKQRKSPPPPVNPKKWSKQASPPTDTATGDNDFNIPEPTNVEHELLDELVDLDGVDDEAKVANDNEKVSTFRTQAVEKARLLGIVLSEEEASTALGLFPKVNQLSLIQSSLMNF